MHLKRCYVSVAACKNYIYAMGGCDGNIRHNTVERYNIEKNQWEYVAPMHYQRSDSCATTLNGFVCLFK